MLWPDQCAISSKVTSLVTIITELQVVGEFKVPEKCAPSFRKPISTGKGALGLVFGFIEDESVVTDNQGTPNIASCNSRQRNAHADCYFMLP